jgi:hypothetical protein
LTSIEEARMSTPDARTRWGRTKGGRAPAMAVALPAGLALAGITSAVAAWAGFGGSRPAIAAVVMAACLAAPAVLLVWVVVVDRQSLAGTADRPEESIESRWYDRAAAGAQTDVVLVAAIAAVVLAVAPDVDVTPELVLVGVIAVSFLCFAVRYQLLRRRG